MLYQYVKVANTSQLRLLSLYDLESAFIQLEQYYL